MVKHDPINNPSHYAAGRKYETIDVIEDWELSYRLGNSVKYISRAGRKDPAKIIEDLKKSRWYLDREIAYLEGKLEPYSVTYEDVLEDYAACAAEGYDFHLDYGNRDVDEQPLSHWDTDDVYMWDPSLGPVELTEEEIFKTLSKKDLNQFQDDEIVTIHHRRGLIIGVKKDGSTCVLNSEGKCE